MEEQAISIVKTIHTVHEIENTGDELYKVGIFTTAAFATGLGAWSLVCLSSAATSSGGPFELGKALFHTIIAI